MRFSLAFTALCASSFLGVSGTPTETQKSGRLTRFSISTSNGLLNRQLTPQEIYTRALTRRKPTPRATAQRRQESPPPPEVNTSPIFIVSPDAVDVYGSLSSTGSSISIGPAAGDSEVTASYSYTPGVESVTNARVTLEGADVSTYTVLALESCGATQTMSTATADYVCLTSSVLGLPSETIPAAGVPLIDGSVSTGAETNIWSVDRPTGAMTPLWVNPDGSTVPLSFVFNPDTGVIYATGSPALFLENNPTWLPFTMTATPAPAV